MRGRRGKLGAGKGDVQISARRDPAVRVDASRRCTEDSEGSPHVFSHSLDIAPVLFQPRSGKREERARCAEEGGGQRQDEWVGWLRVGGRGGRSPRLRANVQVCIKTQRVLRRLRPPQLGYEREVRKAGGLRGDWQDPPPSPSGSILPSSPRQVR